MEAEFLDVAQQEIPDLRMTRRAPLDREFGWDAPDDPRQLHSTSTERGGNGRQSGALRRNHRPLTVPGTGTIRQTGRKVGEIRSDDLAPAATSPPVAAGSDVADNRPFKAG